MGETENPNRLYRYLRAEYAIAALQTGFLKIGRLEELNDPFEFRPAVLGLPEDAPPELIDKHERIGVDCLKDWSGILCFCKVISDPAVWTHYGDDHKGVAFGFDYPMLEEKVKSRDVTKVAYPDSELRPAIDLAVWPHLPYDQKDKIVSDCSGRKAKSWQYEQEYRIFVPFNGCKFENGMYWHKIPENWLVEVVPGIRCPIPDDRFRQALVHGGFKHTEVKRAKASRTKYKVEV